MEDKADRNSKFQLSLSEDQLTVLCTYYPSSGQGKKLNSEEIIERLLDIGVMESLIDKETIAKSVEYVNSSGKGIEKNTVASGTAPFPEIQKHIEIVFDPKDYIALINNIIEENKFHQIDYKKFSRLCLLNEDTIVARVVEEQKGRTGLTVKGVTIDFDRPRFKPVRMGSNLKLKENGEIVTSCFGEYQFRKNTISINNVLKLNHGVNHETGNIHFPGTVIISGEVQFDFHVHAGGNLMVQNTLGAAEVYSGGNIVVMNGGIIGKEQQKVKADNIIKTVHVENAIVEATGNIYIEKSAFHSQLRTNGLLHLGQNSQILGCHVVSRKGVAARDIGNDSGIKGVIICGQDIVSDEKIVKIRQHREELVKSIDELLKFDPMAETYEINAQIKKCDQDIEQIESESECDLSVRVEVKGTVYPGNEIHICQYSLKVTEPLSNGFFYYNKTEDRVKFQNH